MKDEEIGGDDLEEVYEQDVKGCGVNNFKDKKNLMKKIKKLVAQDNKKIMGDEGGQAVPTAYI